MLDPLEIFMNFETFVEELDPDLIRKAASLKAPESCFSRVLQMKDIQTQKVPYKSLYFKWLWQDHLLDHLLKSAKKAAAPDQPVSAIQLPWWCCVELRRTKQQEESIDDAMAKRFADLLNGKSLLHPPVSTTHKRHTVGYDIIVTGCSSGTATAAVQKLIEYVAVIQKKKKSMPGYRRPDISLFDLSDSGHNDSFETIPIHSSLCWKKRMEKPIRSLDSVHISRGLRMELVHDLKTFLGKKDICERRGLLWRRCYLLHGLPGNGKTSFIRAVANELGCDIFNLSVSHARINDSNWRAVLEPLAFRPTPSILLLEDFDGSFIFNVRTDAPAAANIADDEERGESSQGAAMAATKAAQRPHVKTRPATAAPVNAADIKIESNGGGGLTYPAVLAMLESGLCALIFITTNSISTLQQMKALSRPGRIDITREVKNATPEQVKGFFNSFYAEYKKSDWKNCSQEDLGRDFDRVFDAAQSQVVELNPRDAADGEADAHLDDASQPAPRASASDAVETIGQQCELYDHRMSHLARIKEKVAEICQFTENVDGADRKHWLSVLASIAGNHFQSERRIHKYSMAQVEKFFQSMTFADKLT